MMVDGGSWGWDGGHWMVAEREKHLVQLFIPAPHPLRITSVPMSLDDDNPTPSLVSSVTSMGCLPITNWPW